MAPAFLLYGANGFVGQLIARAALRAGLRPVLAGRDAAGVAALAAELGLHSRIFDLDRPAAVAEALDGMAAVLHCAGPFVHTSAPMVRGCLERGVHYLDLTGEIPVYQAIAAQDAAARARRVMLLPGVGFDVVPTDCLAVHLKQRLPSASRLTLAFMRDGPAGLPPGTQRTAIELVPQGLLVRRGGRLQRPAHRLRTRQIDFGQGPVTATRLTWGDVFMAGHSTGIPDIEDNAALRPALRWLLAALELLRPLFRLPAVRRAAARAVRPGPTPAARERTRTHVWGEVRDGQGNRAAARLHGPEAGVDWTVQAALAVLRRVLAGQLRPGFQTPGRVYGADLVLDCAGVTREDLP